MDLDEDPFDPDREVPPLELFVDPPLALADLPFDLDVFADLEEAELVADEPDFDRALDDFDDPFPPLALLRVLDVEPVDDLLPVDEVDLDAADDLPRLVG